MTIRGFRQPRTGGAPPTRGQTLVEFALVLPLFFFIVLIVVDFGRGIYAFNAVSNAAREGARTAIVNQNLQDITNRVSAQATALGISPAATPSGCPPNPPGVTTGLSGTCVWFVTANGAGSCVTTANPQLPDQALAPGCVAVVSVKYKFSPITTALIPLIGGLVGQLPPMTLTSTSKQMIESVCTGSGCPIP